MRTHTQIAADITLTLKEAPLGQTEEEVDEELSKIEALLDETRLDTEEGIAAFTSTYRIPLGKSKPTETKDPFAR